MHDAIKTSYYISSKRYYFFLFTLFFLSLNKSDI